MITKNHTRNQRRMYRIHKQEEKILEQELLISSLQNQLQQKENIIKEVREEIEKLANLYDDNYTITDKAKDILEILNKVD